MHIATSFIQQKFSSFCLWVLSLCYLNKLTKLHCKKSQEFFLDCNAQWFCNNYIVCLFLTLYLSIIFLHFLNLYVCKKWKAYENNWEVFNFWLLIWHPKGQIQNLYFIKNNKLTSDKITNSVKIFRYWSAHSIFEAPLRVSI